MNCSVEYNISSSFAEQAARHSDKLALVAGSASYTYEQLKNRVASLATELRAVFTNGRVGILGSRSPEACIGILAAAWAGGTYVPLGLKLPEDRLVELFHMLDLDALIVDDRGLALLSPALLSVAPKLIVVPGSAHADRMQRLGVVSMEDIGARASDLLERPVPVKADDLAYIEFTSGTTGRPKGVMVPCRAVRNYLEVSRHWYRFGPEDRCAETCDITFDLSVHNMFCAWGAGASLYLMSPLDMTFPAQFIRKHSITTWLSVPSVVAMMHKAGTLRDAGFPSLRLSLFCGEPLPVSAADAWSRAAPGSVVDNIYGPTEATVACLRQTWSKAPRATAARGIVAIGQAYPGMKAMIVDAGLQCVPDGMPGEIALSGEQLAKGYLGQTELTNERFPLIEGERWYLTGDLGVCDDQGVFHHLGRIDNQVKVQGHRVELEEVEMHLRKASGAGMAAAVAWPTRHGAAEGLVGFCICDPAAEASIRQELQRSLPGYMIPRRIEFRDALPLNSNGKIDRKALLAELDHEGGPTPVSARSNVRAPA